MARVKEFAFQDPKSLALYILNVDQVRWIPLLLHGILSLRGSQIREFRDRHWRFAKEYIIRRSSYTHATGGSPILKYLPQARIHCSICVFILTP